MKSLEPVNENTDYKINNIDGSLEFVRLANSRGYLWYRGQRDDSWDIESSVSRDKNRVPINSISSIKYTITDFAEGIEKNS
ncbi:FRG domain-containing protein [Leuconostoc citreum]|uniref:FRG domain-containing protein n=1 Tax=Leuconostoc citreum TaxID=33964 RepID=UPI00200B71B8|nr:FRG domain-containing protein [Leuconostoc citreum]MCK8605759.1 FRG domain-containing protein [Leuconostoc citreum]